MFLRILLQAQPYVSMVVCQSTIITYCTMLVVITYVQLCTK